MFQIQFMILDISIQPNIREYLILKIKMLLILD